MNKLATIEARMAEVQPRIGVLADADELTDEERTEWDALTTEWTDLEGRHAAAKKDDELRSRVAAFAASPAHVEDGDGTRNAGPTVARKGDDPFEARSLDPRRNAREMRDAALRVIDGDDISPEAKEAAAGRVRSMDNGSRAYVAQHILLTGHPDYRSAFPKLVTQDQPFLSSDEQRAVEAVRAIQVSVDGSGGFLAPYLIDPTLTSTSTLLINPFRAISTVKTIAGPSVNLVTTGGVTAAFGAESSEVADGTPTLANLEITAHKAHAFVPFSMEAEEDLAGLAEQVRGLLEEAKANLEALKFSLGSGTTEPWGLITRLAANAGSRVASATADVFAAADVFALIEALPTRFRPVARWMAALPTINAARKFGTSYNYAFLTDLVGDTPAQMLGKPISENDSMDGVINAAADNDILVVGDFSRYVIVDRIGMQVELVPFLFGANRRPTGERGWYAHWRTGADVLDLNAFRLLRV